MFITRENFNQQIKEAYRIGFQNGLNHNILFRILNTPVEELLKPSIPECIKENFKDYV